MCFFVRFRRFRIRFQFSVLGFCLPGGWSILDPAANPGGFTRRRLTKALTVLSSRSIAGERLTTAFNQSILNGNQAGSLN